MELTGQGTIHTWTRCHFAGERFAAVAPYTLVLVEFDGVDTMTFGRLEGGGAEEVRIGMQVRPVLDDTRDYMRFEPL